KPTRGRNMATQVKSTKKTTTTTGKPKPKAKSNNSSSKGFGLGFFMRMIKEQALPASVAVVVVALAAGISPNKDGQKFNLTRTMAAALIPYAAGKILKKKVSEKLIERIITWAVGLSLVWDGARATLMQFGFLATAITKAEALG